MHCYAKTLLSMYIQWAYDLIFAYLSTHIVWMYLLGSSRRGWSIPLAAPRGPFQRLELLLPSHPACRPIPLSISESETARSQDVLSQLLVQQLRPLVLEFDTCRYSFDGQFANSVLGDGDHTPNLVSIPLSWNNNIRNMEKSHGQLIQNWGTSILNFSNFDTSLTKQLFWKVLMQN